MLTSLTKASTNGEWRTVVLFLEVMQVLVLAKLAYVVNVQIVRDVTLNDCDMQINLHEVPLVEQECFIDLQCYVRDSVDVKSLLVAMTNLIKEEPDVRWPELTWFVEM